MQYIAGNPRKTLDGELLEVYLARIGAKNNPEKKEDDCISQRD